MGNATNRRAGIRLVVARRLPRRDTREAYKHGPDGLAPRSPSAVVGRSASNEFDDPVTKLESACSPANSGSILLRRPNHFLVHGAVANGPRRSRPDRFNHQLSAIECVCLAQRANRFVFDVDVRIEHERLTFPDRLRVEDEWTHLVDGLASVQFVGEVVAGFTAATLDSPRDFQGICGLGDGKRDRYGAAAERPIAAVLVVEIPDRPRIRRRSPAAFARLQAQRQVRRAI